MPPMRAIGLLLTTFLLASSAHAQLRIITPSSEDARNYSAVSKLPHVIPRGLFTGDGFTGYEGGYSGFANYEAKPVDCVRDAFRQVFQYYVGRLGLDWKKFTIQRDCGIWGCNRTLSEVVQTQGVTQTQYTFGGWAYDRLSGYTRWFEGSFDVYFNNVYGGLGLLKQRYQGSQCRISLQYKTEFYGLQCEYPARDGIEQYDTPDCRKVRIQPDLNVEE